MIVRRFDLAVSGNQPRDCTVAGQATETYEILDPALADWMNVTRGDVLYFLRHPGGSGSGPSASAAFFSRSTSGVSRSAQLLICQQQAQAEQFRHCASAHPRLSRQRRVNSTALQRIPFISKAAAMSPQSHRRGAPAEVDPERVCTAHLHARDDAVTPTRHPVPHQHPHHPPFQHRPSPSRN